MPISLQWLQSVKLAFCLFKYFPFGGLQRDFLRIAQECLRRGHQVDVFTMKWEGERDPKLSVNILLTKGWQNHTRSRHFARQMEQYAQNYDLMVGFNKMPGLDVYYAADTCYQAKVQRLRPLWHRFSLRYRALQTAEAAVFTPASKTQILLISPTQQADFTQYYSTPAERFHLLPPGVTSDRIRPENASFIRQTKRSELGIKEHEIVLLSVGSGFKTKGLDRALLSLAALPDELRQKTRFYIVGTDNPKPFQRLARQLGVAPHICFLGGRNDVSQLLLASDVLLHPAYNENTGTVLLEALVAGLPVITTDICGYAKYILEAKAGVVMTSPFQQAEFNHAVAKIVLSDKCDEWQQNAITFSKTADIYDMPVHAVDLLESFKR